MEVLFSKHGENLASSMILDVFTGYTAAVGPIKFNLKNHYKEQMLCMYLVCMFMYSTDMLCGILSTIFQCLKHTWEDSQHQSYVHPNILAFHILF